MPKNTSKTGKSSKTARVLSLLTDPAASLLGGSRNHKDEDDETEVLDASASRGLDDAATESRIQASLAAEEDSLVTELFGKPNPPSRARQAPAQEAPARTPDNSSDTAYLVPPQSAPPQQAAAPAQEPDPRTLELLSMLSNPTTLGNSAMPSYTEEEPLRPAALDMDFADELTAGMAEQPASLRAEPEPEPAPPPVQRPAAQPVRQAAPQPFAQSAAPSVRQPAQSAQRPAPQPAQSAAPRPAAPQDHEEFVCFNLTQALVEDKADRLMKQFGMCTCNRCKVDVTAIALSNLPAKYVAMQNRDILPLLSMYEEKYSAAVTVQVMSACRMVMKRPHHGR